MTRILPIAVLVLVTSAFGVLFFELISFFLLPLFLASVVVVVFRPWHDWLLRFARGHRYLTAALTTVSVLLAVLLPSILVVALAGSEASRLLRGLDEGEVRDKLQRARASLGLNYPYSEELRYMERSLRRLQEDAREGAAARGNVNALRHLCEEWGRLEDPLNNSIRAPRTADFQTVASALATARDAEPGTFAYQQAMDTVVRRFRDYRQEFLGGSWRSLMSDTANPTSEDLRALTEQWLTVTPDRISSLGSRAGLIVGRGLFGVLIFLVATFFFLADGSVIAAQLMALSPLDDRHDEQLLADFIRVTRAVVAGSLAAAVAQGVLAGIGFRFAGLESVFLLTVVTSLTAMIPFVGAAFVWLPVSLWLMFIEQRTTAGISLAIYGMTVISTVDNIIKPWILHGHSAMHPLAALMGVLGGVQLLGPSGVFIGPMAVAFLQTLLRLLHREVAAASLNDERQHGGPAGVRDDMQPVATANPSPKTSPQVS